MKDIKIEIQIEFSTQKISINYLAMSTLCCIFAQSQSLRLWRRRYRPTHPSVFGFGFDQFKVTIYLQKGPDEAYRNSRVFNY